MGVESFCASFSTGAVEEDKVIALGVFISWGNVIGMLSGSGDVGGTSSFGDAVGDDGRSVIIVS